MNTPSQNQAEESLRVQQPGQGKARKPRNVYSCNFRSAGRMSNEDARALTVIHEGFAQHVSGALDAYFGTSIEVTLKGMDQLSIKDHLDHLSTHCYIVPFLSNSMFVECDVELVFPIIEMLLGGSGST